MGGENELGDGRCGESVCSTLQRVSVWAWTTLLKSDFLVEKRPEKKQTPSLKLHFYKKLNKLKKPGVFVLKRG